MLKEANTPFREWAKDMKRHFTKEYICMTNEQKRC